MVSAHNSLPQLSVIVPIYNGESDLPDLLHRLRQQDYPADRVEYLLVDNASRDRSAEMLQTAAQDFQSQGLTLKALQEMNIQSSYAARNTGIRAATSEILVFTDADCRPRTEWLRNLIIPFADAAIGMVAGEVTALPGKTLLEQHADRGNTLSQIHTLNHPFLPYGQTANLAVRRSVFVQIGLFRPYLTTGGDADICWRMQQQTNWKIEFAATAIVEHRHRSTWSDLQSQWRRYGRSNRYLHDLHGVDLMPAMSSRDAVYRWSRWVLKELPIASLKLLTGKAKVVDLVSTPIGLFCRQSRFAGQQSAQLPEKAREIEWLQP